jgi:hypothetical protein
MYIEGSSMGVIHRRLLSPKRQLLGLMKSHFDEKPLWWKAALMKSRFDEKPLWWKAALMKGHFDEKPLWQKAASMKSCFHEKPFHCIELYPLVSIPCNVYGSFSFIHICQIGKQRQILVKKVLRKWSKKKSTNYFKTQTTN